MENTQMTQLKNIEAPDTIVIRFLEALEQQNYETISELLAPNIAYTNVSLPTFRGKKLVFSLIKTVLRKGTALQVKKLNVSFNGNVVLTERIDVVIIGPLHVGFWICGKFEVENGKITVWRDYFDWFNLGKGFVKGLLGLAIPTLRADIRNF